MKISKTGLALIFLFYIAFSLNAQEIIIPLGDNQEAAKFYKNQPASRKAVAVDTLELPFIDDFSDHLIRPNPLLWADFDVYLNNKYPVFPPSVGSATFDALRYDGSHYPTVSTDPYIADILTSHPLNLAYPASDSIYLSFFFQPMGLGEMPETGDSLCLDFYDIVTDTWERKWAVSGSANKPFQQVMIPIAEERYLTNGFRFRFFNYASQTRNTDYVDLRSNVDHWHLDYVRLNRNRSIADTVLRDVAFINPLPSILKTYESVPWRHLGSLYFTERSPYLEVVVKNNDSINRNVTRYLEITDLIRPNVYKTTPTASDIPREDSVLFRFEYDYPFNFNIGDSARFLIETYLRTDAFDYKPNDTLRNIQVFSNYYAYDDGSAEAGYGLRGNNSQNASAAVKFTSTTPDSLRAVDMFFNQVMDSINLNYYFYLKVWNDNNGVPGQLIYSQLGVRPQYSQSLNEFVRFELDSAIAINGTFYVGWTKTVDRMLNMGMDLNKVNSNKIFYNTTGTWVNTQFQASLMLRPILSMTPLATSFKDVELKEMSLMKIYPNPADHNLNIDINDRSPDGYTLYIMDVTGRKVADIEPLLNNEINVTDLKNGIYFIFLINRTNGTRFTEKLIINH